MSTSKAKPKGEHPFSGISDEEDGPPVGFMGPDGSFYHIKAEKFRMPDKEWNGIENLMQLREIGERIGKISTALCLIVAAVVGLGIAMILHMAG